MLGFGFGVVVPEFHSKLYNTVNILGFADVSITRLAVFQFFGVENNFLPTHTAVNGTAENGDTYRMGNGTYK